MAQKVKITIVEITLHQGEFYVQRGVGIDRSPKRAYIKAWNDARSQEGSEFCMGFREVWRGWLPNKMVALK